MSLTTDGSLYFEILDDGTTRSDHSAVIQLAIDTCDSHARYLLTQTDLANIRPAECADSVCTAERWSARG